MRTTVAAAVWLVLASAWPQAAQPSQGSARQADSGPMEHPATISSGPEFEIQSLVLSPTKRSYRMSVRSKATKDVRFMAIEVRAGSRLIRTNGKSGEDGAALFPAGKLMETSVFLAPADRPDTIQIGTVLWMDGTVTGAPAPAAERLIFDQGEMVQVQRIVELLRPAVALGAMDPAAGFAKYGEGVTELAIEPSQELLDGLRQRPVIPGVKLSDAEIKGLVASPLKSLKKEALDNFVEFKTDLSARSSHPAGVELGWLKDQLARYEKFLANLKAFPR